MHADAAHVAWRTRSAWEGGDLGVRVLHANWAPVFRCYLIVGAPLFLLFALTFDIAPWLPALLIWWFKPWLDRTILFALSRAVFGTSTTALDVWRAQKSVWWSQLASTLTLRRLSASRSFTQPILQLEGLSGKERRARVVQLSSRHRGVARLMTQSFAAAEFSLCTGMIALQLWLSPHPTSAPSSEWFSFFSSPSQNVLSILYYAVTVLFLEPFYVAAGFGMYLNRRVELEAWDIEQQFREAFHA